MTTRTAPVAPKRAKQRPKVTAARSRSALVPGAGDPVVDEALRAGQARTGPFTAEHFAAYVAFAGITDRNTALALHRAGVDWDAVNDYTGAGIPSTAYAKMMKLARAGVTPDAYRDWVALGRRHRRAFEAGSVIASLAAVATVEVIAAYLSAPGLSRLRTEDLHVLASAGVPVEEVGTWVAVGVTSGNDIRALRALGCAPAAVAARMALPDLVSRFQVATGGVVRIAQALVRAGAREVLLNRALSTGASPDTITAWRGTGMDSVRIASYLGAGYSKADWDGSADLRAADLDTLVMLAALRGHVFTV